jgi:hypothetical protein
MRGALCPLARDSSLLGAEVLVAASSQVKKCHDCPTTRSTLPPYAPQDLTSTAAIPPDTTINHRSIAHLGRLHSHHRERITRRIAIRLRRPAYKSHKASFAKNWPCFVFHRSVGASFDTTTYRRICTRKQDICRHPSHTRRIHHGHTYPPALSQAIKIRRVHQERQRPCSLR